MTEYEKITRASAFAGLSIREHIENVINDYMNKNHITLDDWHKYGVYQEYERIDGKLAALLYKDEVFHKFIYGPLGNITYTWNK